MVCVTHRVAGPARPFHMVTRCRLCGFAPTFSSLTVHWAAGQGYRTVTALGVDLVHSRPLQTRSLLTGRQNRASHGTRCQLCGLSLSSDSRATHLAEGQGRPQCGHGVSTLTVCAYLQGIDSFANHRTAGPGRPQCHGTRSRLCRITPAFGSLATYRAGGPGSPQCYCTGLCPRSPSETRLSLAGPQGWAAHCTRC